MSAAHDSGEERFTGACPGERLALAREIQRHPNWARVGTINQERILRLAADAVDPRSGLLCDRSAAQIARDYGWTWDQARHTLAALRRHGIAYSRPQWRRDPRYGGRQAASVYMIVRDGIYAPQARRPLTKRQRDGARRAALTRGGRPGRLVYPKSD